MKKNPILMHFLFVSQKKDFKNVSLKLTTSTTMSNQKSTAFLAAFAAILCLFACKSSNDKAGQKSATPSVSIGNYPTPSVNGQLKPYEAVILEL